MFRLKTGGFCRSNLLFFFMPEGLCWINLWIVSIMGKKLWKREEIFFSPVTGAVS